MSHYAISWQARDGINPRLRFGLVWSTVMQPLPMQDLKAQYRTLAPQIEAAVRRVLESQQFIMGPEVEAFEKELAAYLEVPHAIGVASGSDALLVPLMALGV